MGKLKKVQKYNNLMAKLNGLTRYNFIISKGRSSVIWTYLQRYKDTVRTPRSRSATIAVPSDRKIYKDGKSHQRVETVML